MEASNHSSTQRGWGFAIPKWELYFAVLGNRGTAGISGSFLGIENYELADKLNLVDNLFASMQRFV